MRLIDADAKIMAILYDDEHEDWVQKEMTVADYLSFSDTAIPFVDAVPVEWIKSWTSKSENTYYRDQVLSMMKDWEKEHEVD